MKETSWFSRASTGVSNFVGRPLCFGLATVSVLVWGATGPVFHFSDTWQLVMNTASGLITFLMVFLIQGSQNRDTAAIHAKLDELIRSTQSARNALIGVECMEPDDIAKVREPIVHLGEVAREAAVLPGHGERTV